MKRRLFGVVFGAILVSTVLGPHYFLYRRYLWKLSRTNRPKVQDFPAVPHVDGATIRQLGHIATDKRSSFVNFTRQKPPGVLRVGCFGDSFTHGDEVDEESDYPTILGRLVRDIGPRRVEVLNFGSGWHGFHQTFIAWKFIGKKFDLDYVVLGPRCFQEERDTTFCHSRDASAFYLHARFVLKGGGVEMLDVDGEDYFERFDGYTRFLPRWKYLRFDSNPPAFIDCLVPRGRALPNPFYYQYRRMSRAEEAARTYEILLREMAEAKAEVPIIVGQTRPRVLTIAAKAARPNLLPILLHEETGFPYRAPQGHYTRAGNELVARQLLAILTGHERTDLSVVQIHDLLGRVTLEEPRFAPSDTPSSGIEMDGLVQGEFYPIALNGNTSFPLHNAAGLLAFRAPGDAITDAAFLPVGFPVTDGAPVTLHHDSGEVQAIGAVVRVSPHLGLIEGPWRFQGQKNLVLGLEDVRRPANPVRLRVEGWEVLRGLAHGSEATWDGARTLPLLRVRARGDSQIHNGSGIVYLRIRSASGAVGHEPIATWRTVQKPIVLENSQPLVAIQEHH